MNSSFAELKMMNSLIEVTIGDDVSFESATYRLIRNNGDMETVLDFPIPR